MPGQKETLKVKDELLDQALHAMAVGSGSQLSTLAAPSGTCLRVCVCVLCCYCCPA